MAKRFIQRHAPRRARRLLVAFVAACLCAPCVPATPAAQQKTPLVFMMTTRRDFGDIYKGEDIEQVFPIRNDGDAPLEMDNKPLTGVTAPAIRLAREHVSRRRRGGSRPRAGGRASRRAELMQRRGLSFR